MIFQKALDFSLQLCYPLSNRNQHSLLMFVKEGERMLLETIQQRYRPNEPILLSDLSLPGVTDENLRKQMKELCDSRKLRRYDTGVYYLPSASRLKGGTTLAPGLVAQYKYVNRNGKTEGYYSGYTFANQLGLTTQVPFALEIVTNQEKMRYREVEIKGQRIVLRRPRAPVTAENAEVLQLLDLLKEVGTYTDGETADAAEKLQAYVKKQGIKKSQVDEYIRLFPDKTYRGLYEMGLYNVFAS